MKRIGGAALLFLCLGWAPLVAQRLSPMPVEAADLVVQIIAGPPDDEEVGAGVVLAASNRVVIATAAHVVRSAGVGGPVRVVFQFARRDTLRAVVDTMDRDLDLAIVSLPRGGPAAHVFAFNREGNPATLEGGALVAPVGCPERRCWTAPVSGDRVIAASPRRIRFESFFVSPGSSGGALFNAQWEVVGIVIEKNNQEGIAIGIEEVKERVRAWRRPIQLAPARIPRAGYKTRLSVVGLAPTSSAIRQSGRWPSGRLAVNLRGQERIGWHLSAIRLAPRDLEVSGGMIGASVSLRTGRLGLSPFAEAGVARVKGRFASGSYFVQTAGGPVLVPIWETVTNDVLGVGGGADLEFLILPHIAITAIAGHWDFRTDSRAPSVPDVFVGGGLKVAF